MERAAAKTLKRGDFSPEIGIVEFVIHVGSKARIISAAGNNVVFNEDDLVSVTRNEN